VDAPDTRDLTWSPITGQDAEPLSALLIRIATDDGDPETFTPQDVADELSSPWLDLPRYSILGRDGAGVPRAFGLVSARPGDPRPLHVQCWGGVDRPSRGTGIGRALLGWQLRTGRDLVAARRAARGGQLPALLVVEASQTRTDAARLVERAGLTPTRWFTELRRSLAEPGPPVEVPPGLRLVPWSADLDDPVRRSMNEAFADSWGFQVWTEQLWAQWASGHRNFRPDWSFAVLAGDQVAGAAMSSAYDQDWERLGVRDGWTDRLGVRRPWRGRGVATALLAATLRAFAGSGMDAASLSVDSQNPSGAVALYTGLGYRPVRCRVSWTVPV
jgi:GNAT superfamily N-acetyltransferase